jgi:hypothetical protein
VEATPSDKKMFSNVVFMKSGKRFGLSAAQKLEVRCVRSIQVKLRNIVASKPQESVASTHGDHPINRELCVARYMVEVTLF